GVEPAAEPTRGVARGEPDLHAPRHSFTAVLSALPTPTGVARTRSASTGYLCGPLGPRRARAGTGHQRQPRVGRGLAGHLDGSGPRPRLVAVSVARKLSRPRVRFEIMIAERASFTSDRVPGASTS